MFAETEDQQLFESAATRFMAANYPIERVRELRGAKTTLEPTRWREAAELGSTTLLVPERAGGGSISGNGLADMLIVASLFGLHAAPGPFIGTNAVAAALGRWGSDHHSGVLTELMSGDAVGAWANTSTVRATTSGTSVTLRGRAAKVESAADAQHLLVSADGAQYLVPLDSSGVDVQPLDGIDLTRRFADVVFDDVTLPIESRVGDPGSAEAHDAELLDIVVVLALGEMVGAMQRAFDMTLDWTLNRYSFGRPLASYQEIKHRVADLRTQLEACEAVASRAAMAVGSGAPDGREWACAGMAHVGRHAPEVIQDCIQLHGGIGVTFDHDLHIFLRRATVDAHAFGSPSTFSRRLGALVAAAAGTTARTGATA